MLRTAAIPILTSVDTLSSRCGKRKTFYLQKCLPTFNNVTLLLRSLNMFVGEAAVWIVHFYMVWDRRRSLAKQIPVPPSSVAQLDAATIVDDVDAEVAKHTDQLPLNGSRPLLFWIPTLCDLTATTASL